LQIFGENFVKNWRKIGGDFFGAGDFSANFFWRKISLCRKKFFPRFIKKLFFSKMWNFSAIGRGDKICSFKNFSVSQILSCSGKFDLFLIFKSTKLYKIVALLPNGKIRPESGKTSIEWWCHSIILVGACKKIQCKKFESWHNSSPISATIFPLESSILSTNLFLYFGFPTALQNEKIFSGCKIIPFNFSIAICKFWIFFSCNSGSLLPSFRRKIDWCRAATHSKNFLLFFARTRKLKNFANFASTVAKK